MLKKKDGNKKASRKTKSAQSAMEYLTTYGWAFLAIAGVIAFLFIYSNIPNTIAPSTCIFSEGFHCNAVVLGTGGYQAMMVVSVTNNLRYDLKNPSLVVTYDNVNMTVPGSCFPDYLLPGGSAICEVPLTESSNIRLGQYFAGNVYMKAQYCGPTINNCTNPPNQTYIGTIQTHATALVSPNIGITLTAMNVTNVGNPNVKDTLHAQVMMFGSPLKGATVNFTENDSRYLLSPRMSLTDSLGTATSYISGSVGGKVKVTATYAGMSSSVIVTFTNTTTATTTLTTVTSTTVTTTTASTTTIPTTIPPSITFNINPTYSCTNHTTPGVITQIWNCSSHVVTAGMVNVTWIISNPPSNVSCIVYRNGTALTSAESGPSGFTFTGAPLFTPCPANETCSATETLSVSCDGTTSNGTYWSGTQQAKAYGYNYPACIGNATAPCKA